MNKRQKKKKHTCGKYIYTTSNGSDNHFPGCHKVHIECANKTIEEARKIFMVSVAHGGAWPSMEAWLESLGEK